MVIYLYSVELIKHVFVSEFMYNIAFNGPGDVSLHREYDNTLRPGAWKWHSF